MVPGDFNMFLNCVVLVLTIIIESATGRSGLHSEQSAPPSRVQQCREGCLEKFATDDFACLQGPECAMNGFPTYNFYSLSDALHLLCWDQCAAPTKINTSIKDTWALRTISMVRQDSLVSADVTWPLLNEPSQCLVTWEVAGGGLMGNLLTDSSSVQLSLWPETKYRVQVTCKNKQTEVMSRSQPLILDTSEATILPISTTTINSINDIDTLNDPNMDIEIPEINHNEYNHLSSNNHEQKKNSETKNYGIWTINEKQREVMLGICAAILVFLCILVVFILNFRKTMPNDKESLLQNEVSFDFNTQTTVHV